MNKRDKTLINFTRLVNLHLGRMTKKDGALQLTGAGLRQHITPDERAVLKKCSPAAFELLALVVALDIANPGRQFVRGEWMEKYGTAYLGTP